MQGTFAVIGWGSLIWDLDDLAPKVDLPWHMERGPRLPMEFSRISPKRKMGLVVCLDPERGVPCPTHAIASRRTDLETVIADLAARERTMPAQIGGVCLRSGARQGRSGIAEAVADWCAQAGWQGAVWTDLLANFAETRGEAFSIARAIAYLGTLSGESLDEAVRYIENAPRGTDTPLRRALGREAWWQAHARRLGDTNRTSQGEEA